MSAGRRASSGARPEALGPRNCGQSEARLEEARDRAARRPRPNSPAFFRIIALRDDGLRTIFKTPPPCPPPRSGEGGEERFPPLLAGEGAGGGVLETTP